MFRRSEGKQAFDLIWGFVPLISARLRDMLMEGRLSGWTTYDVEFDTQVQIGRYFGLVVKGRCDTIGFDPLVSEPVYDRVAEHLPALLHYKGLALSTETWDGSDFFMEEQRRNSHVIVTDRVRTVLKKIKNLAMDDVTEMKLLASALR